MSQRRKPTSSISLFLWQHRHLLAAICIGISVFTALSMRLNTDAETRAVWVTTRSIATGELISKDNLQLSNIPTTALPADDLITAPTQHFRSKLNLPKGTIVLNSMTTIALTDDLLPDQRLIEIPVTNGIELAHPGTYVDVIGCPAGSSQLGTPPQVLAHSARVVLIRDPTQDNKFSTGTKVTLLTIVVSSEEANLVAGAATSGMISVVLTP